MQSKFSCNYFVYEVDFENKTILQIQKIGHFLHSFS